MNGLRINKYFIFGVIVWLSLFLWATWRLEERGWLYCILMPLAFVVFAFSDLWIASDDSEIHLGIFKIPYVKLSVCDVISVEKYSMGRFFLRPWSIFNFYTAIGWATPLGLLINHGTYYLFVTKKGPNLFFTPMKAEKILHVLEEKKGSAPKSREF